MHLGCFCTINAIFAVACMLVICQTLAGASGFCARRGGSVHLLWHTRAQLTIIALRVFRGLFRLVQSLNHLCALQVLAGCLDVQVCVWAAETQLGCPSLVASLWPQSSGEGSPTPKHVLEQRTRSVARFRVWKGSALWGWWTHTVPGIWALQR